MNETRIQNPGLTVEALAEVLAAHQRLSKDVRWSPADVDWVHWWRCACGVEVRTDEADPFWFEAHVATALLASPALATLRAHERANALRDAADECHKEARWQTELQVRHTGTPSASQHYLAARQLSRVEGVLRDRADRQEPRE